MAPLRSLASQRAVPLSGIRTNFRFQNINWDEKFNVIKVVRLVVCVLKFYNLWRIKFVLHHKWPKTTRPFAITMYGSSCGRREFV